MRTVKTDDDVLCLWEQPNAFQLEPKLNPNLHFKAFCCLEPNIVSHAQSHTSTMYMAIYPEHWHEIQMCPPQQKSGPPVSVTGKIIRKPSPLCGKISTCMSAIACASGPLVLDCLDMQRVLELLLQGYI